MKRDPKQWTIYVLADFYGFAPSTEEGWASRKDTYFVGKFKANNDLQEKFYPEDRRTLKVQRVLEFLAPSNYLFEKTQAVEHHHGQHKFWGLVRSKPDQLGKPHIDPPY